MLLAGVLLAGVVRRLMLTWGDTSCVVACQAPLAERWGLSARVASGAARLRIGGCLLACCCAHKVVHMHIIFMQCVKLVRSWCTYVICNVCNVSAMAIGGAGANTRCCVLLIA